MEKQDKIILKEAESELIDQQNWTLQQELDSKRISLQEQGNQNQILADQLLLKSERFGDLSRIEEDANEGTAKVSKDHVLGKQKRSLHKVESYVSLTGKSSRNSICRTNSKNSCKKVESLVDLAKAAISSLIDISENSNQDSLSQDSLDIDIQDDILDNSNVQDEKADFSFADRKLQQKIQTSDMEQNQPLKSRVTSLVLKNPQLSQLQTINEDGEANEFSRFATSRVTQSFPHRTPDKKSYRESQDQSQDLLTQSKISKQSSNSLVQAQNKILNLEKSPQSYDKPANFHKLAQLKRVVSLQQFAAEKRKSRVLERKASAFLGREAAEAVGTPMSARKSEEGKKNLSHKYKSLVDILLTAGEGGNRKSIDQLSKAKTVLSQIANHVLNLKHKATIEFQNGKFEPAQKLFEDALDLFPRIKELENTAASNNQGSSKQSNKNENQIHNLISSTNIYQIFQECHMNLALCLIRQTQFEDGIACLTSLLHYSPDNLHAHYLRGKAFRCMNEYQIALWDFNKALEICENQQRHKIIPSYAQTEQALRKMKEEVERLLESQRVEEVLIHKRAHPQIEDEDSSDSQSDLFSVRQLIHQLEPAEHNLIQKNLRMTKEQRMAQYFTQRTSSESKDVSGSPVQKATGFQRKDSHFQFTHGGLVSKTIAADIGTKDQEEIAQILNITDPGIRKTIRMIASLIKKNLFSKNSIFNYFCFAMFYFIFVRKHMIGQAILMVYRIFTRSQINPAV